MSLTKDRDTPRRDGVQFGHPVAGSTRIFAGAIVGLNSAGWAIPAGPAAVAIVGVAEEQIDNRDGANGDQLVPTLRGLFALDGTGISRGAIGSPVKAVDDATVALITGTEDPAAVVAGTIRDKDGYGVWVEI